MTGKMIMTSTWFRDNVFPQVVIPGAVLIAMWLRIAGSAVLADDRVNFNRDIRPLLSDKCFACHGLDQNARKADLRLDQREVALAMKAIVPGRPQESSLVERIFSTDADAVMPPVKSNKSLTTGQKELLRRWIEEGAEYHPHWSFIPVPKTVPVPEPKDASHWIRSPIDAFILDRLEKEGISPARETTREKWLRRASFDLTGLPPTLTDLDQFLTDQASNAYEAAADRLLDSPAFGERMANEWLDVARYADTFGYQADRDTHVWPWRDWVIRAFNQNLPYDQFITWQTAGDLEPDATQDQRLATAFNRLHRQTNEGGSIEEEFRQAYIADRVVTNGTAFLGLTFDCARCHDHKFDPISQADFYKLAAFFANIDEHGLYSHFTETTPTPALLLYEGDQRTRHQELLNQIRDQQAELSRIRAEARQRFLNHSLSKATIHDLASLVSALNLPDATAPDQKPTETNEPVKSPSEPKLRFRFEEGALSGENKFVPGVIGQAIEFSGDDTFICAGSGQFGRTTPFTLAFWLKPVEHKPRVIVAHQCGAAEDAAYRGYSLVLDNGHPQFSLIHFWPGNAIQVQSQEVIPLNQWTHFAVTYDGSSQAAGIRLYLNGRLIGVDVVRDKLSRDILYRGEWGDYIPKGVELTLGARFRDVGFRGGAIDELSVYDRELSSLEVLRRYLEEASQSDVAAPKALAIPESAAFEHYLLYDDDAFRQAQTQLLALRRAENEFVSGVRQIMTMQELPQPRPTHLLKRGAYDSPAQLVTADTPKSILPFPEGAPRNRLGLAMWLTDDRNPLTSRVAVNRFWSYLLGRGLVASLADFGGQGLPPTHPELLDWLARDFMEHGWDVKRFCKQIVLSATYRQSSVPQNPRVYADDPDNVLLSRGPRYRLSAEQIRDNVLAVSGLLVSKSGGPSVMPYQPAGLWEESGTGKSYAQSKGEGLYRRSLYTFWRRTSPPPTMLTFDATSRETCTARRERTSTPLQSLVLLNDPQHVEAARVLAERLLHQSGNGIESRIKTAFRLLTSRGASDKEVEMLKRLYFDQKAHFDTASNDALLFLATGESTRDEKLNIAEHAALTVVVQTLMNFDECVTKR